MTYGNSFADLYDTAHRHLDAAARELVAGSWSATRQERQLTDAQFAEIKQRRLTATTEAVRRVDAAIQVLRKAYLVTGAELGSSYA
jgi:hypothetical protein